MAEITEVSREDEFVEAITTDDKLDITPSGAEELWRIWTYRYENGAEDDYLIGVSGWFADKDFNKRWPLLFADIEYDSDEHPDNEDKAAILFKDARLIDINIVENEIWDDVSMSETLEVIDQTEREDFATEERGHVWIPRSQMTIYDRTE